MQALKDAQLNDQTYQIALHTWEESVQDLPIARSALLPSIALGGSSDHITVKYTDPTDDSQIDAHYKEHTYELGVSQPLIDLQAFSGVKEAGLAGQAAYANLRSAQQDLILRVSSSYFAVMSSLASVRFNQAAVDASWQQYQNVSAEFKAGKSTKTAMLSAKSAYDTAIAGLKIAENTASQAVENLAVLTAKRYSTFTGLGTHMPLTTPSPNDISLWVEEAEKQNFILQSSHYQTLAAKQHIHTVTNTLIPTVTFNADIEKMDSDQPLSTTLHAYSKYTTETAQIAAKWPIFNGGAVYHSRQQALAAYNAARANELNTHRSTIAMTRNDYRNVIANISLVNAYHQSMLSSQQSYDSNQSAYKEGVATLSDLLLSLSNYYAAQENFIRSRYQFLQSTIELKRDVGNLTMDDIDNINRMLTTLVNLPTSGDHQGLS